METDAEEIIEMAARTSKDHKTASPLPPRQSGLPFAIGGSYTLEIKPSLIPHKDAGQGCFIKGQGDAGTGLAFYSGVIYSPAFYSLGVLEESLENYGRTGGSNGLDASVLKTLVLVATRELCDEELLLNYRLTNSKRRPD
ncbi:BnaA02g32970D [Brassica napus]|uniref:BnaA02g32970D protein n=1 Tax=Brassica napus TaxID=3708 RepID=A0A078IC68_BRANA|nr:BnaA02g32970D [Brassica napus]